MAGLRLGEIIKFDDIHGVGVIEIDGGIRGERIKFSYKDIESEGIRMPNEGQLVDFEVVNEMNGRKSVKIFLRDNEKQIGI